MSAPPFVHFYLEINKRYLTSRCKILKLDLNLFETAKVRKTLE